MMKQLWWSLFIRGVAAILFGCAAMFWPGLTLVILIYIFATFAIVDGVVAIAGAFAYREQDENWWLILLMGISLAGIGLVTVFRPGVTAMFLLALIAVRYLISGVLEIVFAIRMRKEIEGEFFMIVSGLLSFCLGLVLIAYPVSGALAMVSVIGIIAIISGIAMTLVSFRVKNFSGKLEEAVDKIAGSSEGQPS